MDLNADLGEGGPCDRELLEVVTSTSVACGYHAGDPATMLATARTAAALGVAVGAHPSFPDREGFGRRVVAMAADSLMAVVADQIGAMAAAATAAGTEIGFVKPHGALYNQAAARAEVAAPVVAATAAAGLALLGPPGSEMHRQAEQSGVRFFCEAFADRAYAPDGTLVERRSPGAVIHGATEVAARALRLAVDGEVAAVDGTTLRVAAHSLCLHGDTPGAVRLARAVRSALEGAGVTVAPFLSP